MLNKISTEDKFTTKWCESVRSQHFDAMINVRISEWNRRPQNFEISIQVNATAGILQGLRQQFSGRVNLTMRSQRPYVREVRLERPVWIIEGLSFPQMISNQLVMFEDSKQIMISLDLQ